MPKQQNNIETAYSFFRYENTDEIHIFEGKFLPDDDCNAHRMSICEKVNRRTEEVKLIRKCLNEDQARARAASLGRSVCGTCVSRLYTTDY